MKRTSSLAPFYKAALKGLEEEKSRIESEIQQVRALYARHTGGSPGRPVVVDSSASSAKPRKARNLSVAARARIAAAQKKRWAEFRKVAKAS